MTINAPITKPIGMLLKPSFIDFPIKYCSSSQLTPIGICVENTPEKADLCIFDDYCAKSSRFSRNYYAKHL